MLANREIGGICGSSRIISSNREITLVNWGGGFVGNAVIGLGAVVWMLVVPVSIPLFGIGLKRLLKALREPSEEEREKHINMVALTWGLLITALLCAGLPRL